MLSYCRGVAFVDRAAPGSGEFTPSVRVVGDATRARLIDAGWVAVAFGVQVGFAWLLRHHDPGRSLEPYGLVLIGAGPVLLWWRRRFPVAVLLSVFALTLSYDLLNQPRGPIWLALTIAFVTCIFARRRLIAWAVLIFGFAVFVGPGNAVAQSSSPLVIVGLSAWMLVLGGGAEAARATHEHHVERVKARAEHARRKASDERLQIARDLHDVLAHHVALISVQSGVALHLLDEHPEQVRPALTAIRQASSEVLRELRGVLELLRAGDASSRQPAPGLRRVDELADSARLAGLRVRLDVRADLDSIPDSVSIAGFRIVQEALTNVVRHAGAQEASVVIETSDDALVICIDDDGHGPKAAVALAGEQLGSGLLGMRERAAALGGEVTIGPGPQGGFRVRARMPIRPAPVDVTP